LRKHPPNPLRSEADAFAFLIWFAVIIAVIVAIILIARAV
jgi:hypothetical protein